MYSINLCKSVQLEDITEQKLTLYVDHLNVKLQKTSHSYACHGLLKII